MKNGRITYWNLSSDRGPHGDREPELVDLTRDKVVENMLEAEVEAKIRSLPDYIKIKVLDYIEFMLSKYCHREAKGFKYDWEGGLSGIGGEFTSVELQHSA